MWAVTARGTYAIVLTCLLAGCALTQRPPRTDVAQSLPDAPISNATVGAAISLPGLAQYLEETIPTAYEDQGDETEWFISNLCWPLKCETKTKVCEWTWYVRVTRQPLQVTPINGGLAVRSNYRLWGRVQTRGPVCPSFQETTEPDGQLDLTITATPRFNDLYALEPRVDYNWNWTVRPGLKAWDTIPVSFGRKAGEAIDKGLADARRKLNDDLARRLDFRLSVEKAWAQLHDPILIGADGMAWLRIKPLGLNATPIVSDENYARIHAGLRSRTEVSFGPQPPAFDRVDLPILRHDPMDGKFALSAVANLDYQTVLDRAHQEWAGQTLNLEWGRLKFHEFRVYQSGDRLVVGTKADILPRKLPYVSGWLYLIGRPVVENNRLYLADLDYRAHTNNPAVQALAFLFQEQAKEELSRRLSFDLAEPIDELVAKLNAIEPAPMGEFGKAVLTVDMITVGSPVPDANRLRIPLTASGKLEALFFPYGEEAGAVSR